VEELKATAVGVVARRKAVRRGGGASSPSFDHGGSGASCVLRKRAGGAERETRLGFSFKGPGEGAGRRGLGAAGAGRAEQGSAARMAVSETGGRVALAVQGAGRSLGSNGPHVSESGERENEEKLKMCFLPHCNSPV